MRQIYPGKPRAARHGASNIGHDHDDTNGFYIYQSGWLAPEGVGSGLHATSYHNTLLIDGNGQYRPPATHYWRNPEDFTGSEGILEATADAPQFNFLAADATQRYKNVEGLSDVTRYVVFIRPNYLVMFDRVEADAPHQVDWVVHLESGASVDGAWIRSGGDSGPLLGIGFAAPQRLAATLGTDRVPYVRMRPGRLRTRCCSPAFCTRQTAAGGTQADDHAGGQNVEAAVLRLQPNDGSQQVIDVVLAFDQPQAPIEIGSYRFDGRVAVVVRGADNALQKLFMYGGTTLTDTTAGELTLIEGLDVSTVFEAIFTGSTASVTGSVSGEITLFAPEAQQVTLNGSPRSFADRTASFSEDIAQRQIAEPARENMRLKQLCSKKRLAGLSIEQYRIFTSDTAYSRRFSDRAHKRIIDLSAGVGVVASGSRTAIRRSLSATTSPACLAILVAWTQCRVL